MSNLTNFKNDLHGAILQIGNKIYDEKITKGQIEPINDSKIKLSNSKRYENNQRIQYKLKLFKDRYDCQIEYMKFNYTNMYLEQKSFLEIFFDEGLSMMVIFLIQKLDCELQKECKNLKNQLQHDMDADFEILLKCVLDGKANILTKIIENLVEEQFQNDFRLATKLEMFGLRNIEAVVNSTICDHIVNNIHMLCAESSAAKLKLWELKKQNQIKINRIKKYINDIKRWKPQLTVCPNIKIWRKHFTKILKKFQKYYNFYNSTDDIFTFDETETIKNPNSDEETPENSLDTTPSVIFAAFDSNESYYCGDESKVFVATETDTIPIKTICEDQTARLRKEELDNLNHNMPPNLEKTNWNLFDTFRDDEDADVVIKNEGEKIRRDSLDIPNVLPDLLLMIDSKKLTTLLLAELKKGRDEFKCDSTSQTYLNMHKTISAFLKQEIEHKLNNNEILNKLNFVLGPAYDAVRLKRISALSYHTDSITILRNRSPQTECAADEQNNQYVEPVPETYPISLKMTHQEYLESFLKLPPYFFPIRKRPQFDTIYKKCNDSDIGDSLLSAGNIIENPEIGPYCNPTPKKDHMKKRRTTTILKHTAQAKLEPFYKMTLRSMLMEAQKGGEKTSNTQQ